MILLNDQCEHNSHDSSANEASLLTGIYLDHNSADQRKKNNHKMHCTYMCCKHTRAHTHIYIYIYTDTYTPVFK